MPNGFWTTVILIVDNLDSFTHNLAYAVRQLGRVPIVVRADAEDGSSVLAGREIDAVVVSPGPKSPARSPAAVAAIRAAYGKKPLLGICLGHQSLAHAFGGRIGRVANPLHGKVSPIEHDGRGIFSGIESPTLVARYHSLCVESLPEGTALDVLARTRDGVIMAVGDPAACAFGLQFHPESFLTPSGLAMLRNFFEIADAWVLSRSPID